MKQRSRTDRAYVREMRQYFAEKMRNFRFATVLEKYVVSAGLIPEGQHFDPLRSDHVQTLLSHLQGCEQRLDSRQLNLGTNPGWFSYKAQQQALVAKGGAQGVASWVMVHYFCDIYIENKVRFRQRPVSRVSVGRGRGVGGFMRPPPVLQPNPVPAQLLPLMGMPFLHFLAQGGGAPHFGGRGSGFFGQTIPQQSVDPEELEQILTNQGAVIERNPPFAPPGCPDSGFK